MKRTLLQARFAVRKARPGTGFGLFATADIKKSDYILEYSGIKIPTPVADKLSSRYLFEIDQEWTIDGSPRANIARYANHSCRPNAECDIRDGRILIFAKKNIKSGDEITIDYGDEYFDEFIKPVGCKCDYCFKKQAREERKKAKATDKMTDTRTNKENKQNERRQLITSSR